MDLAHLNEHFGLPGVLAFHATASGLIRADITTPHANATVYLQGAHLTAWQPTGQQPVIFTSRKTELAPGKAIRGGIPVCFPWFATRHDGKTGPSHGFGRIQDWTLAFAALAGRRPAPYLHAGTNRYQPRVSASTTFDWPISSSSVAL